MRIERKRGPSTQVGAWHAAGPWMRWACKRSSFSAYRTLQRGDLRNIKAGDRVCRDCAEMFPVLAEKTRVVNKPTKIREGVR